MTLPALVLAGRHGSRHSTKMKPALSVFDALAEALRMGGLTPLGREALTWIAEFIDAEAPLLGVYDAAPTAQRFRAATTAARSVDAHALSLQLTRASCTYQRPALRLYPSP